MRINVYNEELTDEVQVVTVTPRPNRTYIGVRFMLASPDELHHAPEDDDRSGITFWLGTPEKAEAYFGRALAAVRAYRKEQRG